MTTDPVAVAHLATRVASRMIHERPAARYLLDDARSAAVLGALSALARGARNPLARANGAVLDLLRNELPRGYRQPRHGRDGMPGTVRLEGVIL